MTSHWTGRHGSIAAELKFVCQQAAQCTVVHEQKNQIGRRATGLVAETSAFSGHKDWRAPSIRGAANRNSAPVLSAENKRKLFITRNDGNAPGLVENSGRYGVWGVHNLLENLSRSLQAVDVIVLVRSRRDQRKNQQCC